WLFTNYPQWAVARFDFPVDRVKSFWLQGVLARASLQLDQWNVAQYREEWLNTTFGRWAASELVKEDWDVVHSWSGVSEEIQIALNGKPTVKTIMRGSSHIQTQSRLLREEEERTGAKLDKPSAWIIEREQREYRLADLIITLSTFSHQSFIKKGVPQ